MYECSLCSATYRKSASLNAHMSEHIKNKNILSKYVLNVKVFSNIIKIHNVPKIVYVCWFGGYKCNTYNSMMSITPNRMGAFNSMVYNIQSPVCLLTFDNFRRLIKPDFQVHRAFPFLSGVHKSDYARCYMLHHYGGGYHDIKYRDESWAECWEKDNWLEDDSIWMYGRREKDAEAIGYPPGMQHIQSEYEKMITMGWIICKPYTPFTHDLMQQIHDKLDSVYDQLRIYPGLKSSGYYADKPFDPVPEESYPLRWLELLGEIFHPLMLKYTDHIKFGLPDALKSKRYK